MRKTRKCKAKSTVTQKEGSTPKPVKKGKKKKPNSPVKAEKNVTLDLLPDEIILCIIHFLAPYHLVRLSLTSSRYLTLVGTLPRFRIM